jgi:hypothetical protein
VLWQKRHWKDNRFNFNTSDGRYCFNVSMPSQGSAKAKWTWNDVGPWSVVDGSWCLVWCATSFDVCLT